MSHFIDWATLSISRASGEHAVVNDVTFRNVNTGGTLIQTIKVPENGKVKVNFGAYYNGGNANEGIFLQLNVTGANVFQTHDNTTNDPRAIIVGQPGTFGSLNAAKQFVGLNPGDTTFALQVRSGGGTSQNKVVTQAYLSLQAS